MNGAGDRPSTRKEQDPGKDDAGADRGDPGQLAAKITMQERPARPCGGARARARRRTSSCSALARGSGWGGASHGVNSMWDAWKSGYRGPWDGADAISKSTVTRWATAGAGRVYLANIRAHTTRMQCREERVRPRHPAAR